MYLDFFLAKNKINKVNVFYYLFIAAFIFIASHS